MGGLAKLFGKWLAKKTGFGIAPKITSTAGAFSVKITELATDKGLTKPYVLDLIQKARGRYSLEAIKHYLESSRNDMAPQITKELIKMIDKKLQMLSMVIHHHHNVTSWFC